VMFPRRAYAANGSTAPDRDRIIVSLGDSYSSGEGNPPFYGKDEFYEMMEGSGYPSSQEDFDYLAHRSQNSWPGQLKLDGVEMKGKRGTQWFFAAVSGAETKHLTQKQKKEFRIQLKSNGRYLEDSINLPPQLDVFDDPRLEGKKVDYVTVTIGGNDVGFADIISRCTKSSAYLDFGKLQYMLDDALETKKDHVVDGIDSKLEEAYRAIHDKAKDATIIVVGYPHLLYSVPVKWLPTNKLIKHPLFSIREAKMINQATDDFNAIIEETVVSCREDGIDIVFVPVAPAFGNHGAYDINPSESCINGLMHTRGSDLHTLYDGLFVNWIPKNIMEIISAYSFHPNKKGIEIYRECVQKEIDDLEAKRPASSPSTSTPDTTTDVSKELPPSQPPTSTPTPPSTPSPQPDLSHVVEDAWSGECVYSVNDGQGGRSTKTAVYLVPKINLDFTNVQTINEEILANFSRARDESDAGYPLTGSDPAFLSVDYEWSVKGNIISLLVTCWRDVPDVPGYYLYTLYVDTGKEVPKGDIIRVAGITEQDYCTRVKEALGSVFWDQSFGPGTEYDLGTWQRYKSYLEDTISQDNVDMAQPFFNENGELCVLGHAFYDAGKNPHDTLVNLENYVLSPYYAETIPMPENTTVVSDKYIVNVANAAYFRSTPSESEDNVICTIPLNTEVGFIEVTDSVFSRIEYNGQYGYVKSEFLGNLPEITASLPLPEGEYQYIVRVDSSAILRKQPDDSTADSNVIAYIPLLDQVRLIRVENDEYSLVEYEGKQGYVRNEFLEESPFNDTYWLWARGVTNGSFYNLVTYRDGTYTAVSFVGSEISGTYVFDGEIMTIEGVDYWLVDGRFESVEEQPVQSVYIKLGITPSSEA